MRQHYHYHHLHRHIPLRRASQVSQASTSSTWSQSPGYGRSLDLDLEASAAPFKGTWFQTANASKIGLASYLVVVLVLYTVIFRPLTPRSPSLSLSIFPHHSSPSPLYPFPHYRTGVLPPIPNSTSLNTLRSCSINAFSLSSRLDSLTNISQVPLTEFAERRNKLAAALVKADSTLYVFGVGADNEYFLNISQAEWQQLTPWNGDGEDLLMGVTPNFSSIHDDGSGTPSNEEDNDRVRGEIIYFIPTRIETPLRSLLGDHDLSLQHGQIVKYEEDQNLFEILYNLWSDLTITSGSSTGIDTSGKAGDHRLKRDITITANPNTRISTVNGLGDAGFVVTEPIPQISQLRQDKSMVELANLRAVNAASTVAIESVKKCLFTGLNEDEVRWAIISVLDAVGIQTVGVEVKYDFPMLNNHEATERVRSLTNDTLLSIRVVARLNGYYSSVTRTFISLPSSASFNSIPSVSSPLSSSVDHLKTPSDNVANEQGTTISEEDTDSEASGTLCTYSKLQQLSQVAQKLQHAALRSIRPGCSGSEIHTAVSETASALEGLPHDGDVKHHLSITGIGLAPRESPYLHQGNGGDVVRSGMTLALDLSVISKVCGQVRTSDALLVVDHMIPVPEADLPVVAAYDVDNKDGNEVAPRTSDMEDVNSSGERVGVDEWSPGSSQEENDEQRSEGASEMDGFDSGTEEGWYVEILSGKLSGGF